MFEPIEGCNCPTCNMAREVNLRYERGEFFGWSYLEDCSCPRCREERRRRSGEGVSEANQDAAEAMNNFSDAVQEASESMRDIYGNTYSFTLTFTEPTIKDKYKIALERSKELLFSMLTKEERKQMEKDGTIKVTGSKGNKYHIDTTYYQQNVYSEDGNIQYCTILENENGAGIFDAPTFPHYDHIIAQKLLIETNEDKFLELAQVNY